MNRNDRQAQREGRIGAKIQQYKVDKQYSDYRAHKYSSFMNGLGLVFGFIILALLVVNVIKIANGSTSVTFTGLLDFISKADVGFSVPNLDYFTNLFHIAKEWSILDGLRIFINSLGSILGVVAYLVSNLVYTITFLGKFLIFLLG